MTAHGRQQETSLRRSALAWALAIVALGAARAQTPAAVAEAMTALRQAGTDIPSQAAAVQALSGLGDSAVQALVKDLGDADNQVRANVAFALGRVRAAAAVESLLARLSEEGEPEVRAAVAEALGRIGEARAVPALIAHASREEAHELDRRGVAVALGTLRAAAGIPLLLRLVDSSNWEERWRAAVALGQVGDPKTRAWVEARVRDGHPVVAGCAAWASESLAGVPGFSLLGQNLRSGDGGVVYGSAWALGVIGTPAAVQTLQAAVREGPQTAQEACRLVLTWLGTTPAELPAARPVAEPVGNSTSATADEPLDLGERWTDRYGRLELTATHPTVISHSRAAPALGAHARPILYGLPNGDLLLAVEPEPEAQSGPRVVVRSRDQGQSWQEEPTLVRRLGALAALRSRSVLVYDEILFAKEGSLYVSDLCVSRDGGRAFGPLLLAGFMLAPEQAARSAPKHVVEAYKPNSAQWSDKSCTAFSGRVVEIDTGVLVGCGLTRFVGDPSNRCLCYRSEDKGLTWAAAATLADQDAVAVAVSVGPDGRLLALLALGTPPMLHAAFSLDGGLSWSEPRSLRLAASGVALCRLSNGVLAACFGGPGVSLMFSLDGTGRTWTDKVRLVDPSNGSADAPGLCEAGPDRLLVVCGHRSTVPEVDAKPTAAVLGAIVTVALTAP
jgi:HEAT repeat protein